MRKENAPLPAPRGREGNMELLRILCMLLILAHHLAWHGAALYAPLRENKALAAVLFAGGQTGVNCFVMITGYYLTAFRARRFFATLLETLFYSVGLTALAYFAGWNRQVTWETVKNAALVVSRSPYWFVTMYLALTAALPVLQPGVKGLSRNAHRLALALGFLYLSVIPTATFQNPSSQFFHQLTWFFFLYTLGAYFKKFPGRYVRWAPLHGAVFLGMIGLMAFLCLWGADHADLFQRVGSRQNFFADKNAVPQVVCSCALFLFCAGLRVKPFRGLTLLSGASFGVYLIHDHGLIRGMIWGQWLKIWQACQGPDFWKTALMGPFLVYLCCAAVDLVRRYALEKPLMKLLNPAFEKIDGWVSR